MQPITVGKPLPNGMRFYAHYDRVAHLSGIGVKCGSIHDPPGKCGMAHKTEHVISQRSKSYSKQQVDLTLWKYLGNPDKWRKTQTDRVSTFYGHVGLQRKIYMLRCFDVLASLVRDQIVTEDDVASERAAVYQEYCLRGVDCMPDLIDNLVHHTMYERNPARHRVDCEPNELNAITPRDIRAFLRAHYVPNNMFGIVLGPSYKEAKKLMQRYFDDWQPGTIAALDYNHNEDIPALTGVKSCEVQRSGIHQYHVAVGWPTETYMSPDAEALDVLSFILEKRLYRLRDENRDRTKGIYRVEVFTPRTLTHGMLYAYFATTNFDYARWGEEVIHEECARFKQEYVLDDELDAARSFLDAEYLDAIFNSPSELTDRIIGAVANGDENLEGFHMFRERLHRVGKKRIMKIANKYLTPSHIRVVIAPV